MQQLIEKAAREAGKILSQHFGKVSTEDIEEKTANDFLSFVDRESESIIIRIIREQYPDHAFLAEESGQSGTNARFCWIIDPLDGTKNYLSGVGVFAVSIALREDRQISHGGVFDPLRNEFFYAERGKGAMLNNSSIRVSSKSDLGEGLIGTGFPFKSKKLLAPYLRSFKSMFLECSGIRRMGAAAIDLAYVAAGRFDGFWELGLNEWDIAAGSLLIEEAGGTVTDFWGTDGFLENNYLVASNGRIHRQMLAHTRRHFPDYINVYQRGKK